MYTHESQSPGFQLQASASKLNPLGPRPFEVTFPGQELASAPTNPFVQRSANSWATLLTAPPTPPAALTSSPEDETEVQDVKLDWRPQFNLFAAEQPPPTPPRSWSIQAKLTIGRPNDPYEQEADQVATQVMKMSAPIQQTQSQNSIQCNLFSSSSGGREASTDSEARSSLIRRLSGRRYAVSPRSGSRYVLLPRQPNGRTLYFFYGYAAGNVTDQAARDSEAPFIEDDVIYAAESGFTVIYDLEGTARDFAGAIFDQTAHGIYWSGHGDTQGNIWTSDGILLGPTSISADHRQVSPNLQYFILAACGSAQAQEAWQRVLPQGCQFEGWLNLTSNLEGIDFTDSVWPEELDQFAPHGGLHPDRELRDYIEDARRDAGSH